MANEITSYWGCQHMVSFDLSYTGKDIRDYTTKLYLKVRREDNDEDAVLTLTMTAQDADTAVVTATPAQMRITPAKYFYSIKITEDAGSDEQAPVAQSTWEIKAP
jgi:hypothetical protein